MAFVGEWGVGRVLTSGVDGRSTSGHKSEWLSVVERDPSGRSISTRSPRRLRASQAGDRQVRLRVLDGGTLKIGAYPAFAYNPERRARPTFGEVRVEAVNPAPSAARWWLRFPAEQIHIPPVAAYFLPLSLLCIEVRPRELQGTFNPADGAAELDLDATFQAVLLQRWVFASVSVRTHLSTAATQCDCGRHQSRATGQRLTTAAPRQYRGTLAGLACVPRTGQRFTDAFLALPHIALARFPVELTLMEAVSRNRIAPDSK
ncbi:hypothetical protein CDCA_CDCA17G4389 [Cyanidium caldarium]|uniref:Uncharacterized protein n=1 Tax=Cyanidium caldarium TaxID=2771 RepID=A0AAV9J1J3_CYACA|nr:hypothetical protein CDCA_CDCA17G4389 [Cyanidium caldarium]